MVVEQTVNVISQLPAYDKRKEVTMFLFAAVIVTKAGYAGGFMRKEKLHRFQAALSLVIMLCVAAGCMQKEGGVSKLRDLDFEILTQDQVGDELSQMIEEKKVLPFRFTYQEDGMLYICIGYGKKPSGGYSITVDELMEAENAIYVDTNLIGPDKEDSKIKGISYPHLVIRTQDLDKSVVFQ